MVLEVHLVVEEDDDEVELVELYIVLITDFHHENIVLLYEDDELENVLI